jgi:hypothetical protein
MTFFKKFSLSYALGGDFHSRKINAVSDYQSRDLAQNLLRLSAFLNLLLKFYGMNQWIFQTFLQLLG